MKDIIINGKIYNNISKLNFKNDLGEVVTFIEESEVLPNPTSSSLFTFSGDSITRYIGNETDIVLPRSYSLSLVEVTKSFETFDEIYMYIEENAIEPPWVVTDSAGVTYTVDYDNFMEFYENRDVLYPITFKTQEQHAIDGDDYVVSKIADNAFAYNTIVKKITILDNITNITRWSLYNCPNLINIIVRDNPVYDSRDNCNAVIETSTDTIIQACNNSIIPNSIKIIGPNSFAGCKKISNITIPNGVVEIGLRAFYDCESIVSMVIPDSVKVIGGMAFRHCKKMTNISIGENVTTIDGLAFYYCELLNNVIIPKSVTFIGDSAFAYCAALNNVSFTNTIGWSGINSLGQKVQIASTGLSNPLTASTYLKTTYVSYDWSRS